MDLHYAQMWGTSPPLMPSYSIGTYIYMYVLCWKQEVARALRVKIIQFSVRKTDLF
jgi:hypothetical protein